MIFYAPAKLNIGLQITGKRADGFHNIETLFYPIPLYDEIKIEPSKTFSLQLDGLPIEGKTEDNTVFRAYQLIQSHHPTCPLKITLTKHIPPGSGLGGPSSDAATFLNAANQLYNLKLNNKQLSQIALSIGSDCPFFLDPKPAYAHARGEITEKMPPFLEGLYAVVISPQILLSTKWAYQQIKYRKSQFYLKNIEEIPHSKWMQYIRNDFESVVFDSYPETKAIQQALLQAGAFYSALSGSGSSLFGLFKHKPSLDNPLRGYRHWIFQL